MEIDYTVASGSQIRPQRMLEAFKSLGYDVAVVMGSCKERKKAIEQVKKMILKGEKYDFLYSESSTMPTALTEKHHLPSCLFLDFNFFNFCKKYSIDIGLFYRDVYWNLKEYDSVAFFKRVIAKIFYRYDLVQYKKYLDVLYLPSLEMYSYVPIVLDKVKALPPAIEKNKKLLFKGESELSFVYIGGLSSLYDLKMFSKSISKFKKFKFNLCTRENEWKAQKNEYNMYLNTIDVFHKNGEALIDIYNISDIAVYFLKPNKIWNFAMGVKLFEYIAHKKPIIAVRGTAVGDFVEKNNIGWVIAYNEIALENLFTTLQKNPKLIEEKITNIEKITSQHTWQARAEQVVKDLS